MLTFPASPDNLIIGGGAGEHPATVVYGLGSLAAAYVLFCIERNTEYFPDSYTAPPQETIQRLNEMEWSNEHTLEFCGWEMTQTRASVELAKSPLHATPLTQKQAPKDWLKYSICTASFAGITATLRRNTPLAEE